MALMGPIFDFVRDVLSLTVGTDIVHKDQGNARYNSLQQFQSFMRQDDNHPSYTNLYTVQFGTPRIFVFTGPPLGNISLYACD